MTNPDLTEGNINEIALRQARLLEEERLQKQDQSIAVAKMRQKIIQHIPYPPFRDETLATLDEMLRTLGYNK